MDTEDQTSGGGIGIIAIAEEHGPLLLAIGVVIVLVVAGRFMATKKTSGASSSSALGGDLSGLQTNAQGQPIVYVPTSTEFYTDNSVNAVSADNAPATIGPVDSTITTAPVTTTSTVTTTQGVQPPGVPVSTGGHPPVPPVRQPPVVPVPPVHAGGLVWDQSYAVAGGDTLSRIAATYTAKVRGQGAPSTVTISYAEIYAHNKTVVDNTARAHGNPIPGGPMNNIFAGERILVPRWVKS